MSALIRIAVLITGAALLLGGLAALVNPAAVAGQLGVAAANHLGAATLRGDLFGFFFTAGAFGLAGGIRRNGALLTVPMMLIGLALCGRIVALFVTPFEQALVPPMVAEAIMVSVFAAGRFVEI
jgi:hypothetical protein